MSRIVGMVGFDDNLQIVADERINGGKEEAR